MLLMKAVVKLPLINKCKFCAGMCMLACLLMYLSLSLLSLSHSLSQIEIIHRDCFWTGMLAIN